MFFKILCLLALCGVCVYVVMHYERFSKYGEKLTGTEEEQEIPIETAEVKMHEMSFSFREPDVPPDGCEGNYYADYEGRGIVFCYYKEQENDLWLPCEQFIPGTDRIFLLSRDGALEEIDDALCVRDEEKRQIGIAAEYMGKLADGDYYIIRTGTDNVGDGGCPWYALHVESRITFNSPQPGIATRGDFRFEQYFDTEAPQDIEIHLYNIGNNTVRKVENKDDRYDRLREGEDYFLTDAGNTLVFSGDYLKDLAPQCCYRFYLELADGRPMEEEVNVVVTKGKINRPILDVPTVYRLTDGGDFVLKLTCDETKSELRSITLSCFDEETGEETAQHDLMEYLDRGKGQLVVPGEKMKEFGKGSYGIGLDYRIGDYFSYNWYDFRIDAD